jgi:hypothetical protein
VSKTLSQGARFCFARGTKEQGPQAFNVEARYKIMTASDQTKARTWLLLRFTLYAALLIWIGALIYLGEFERLAGILIAAVVSWLAGRGHLPTRSNDSWARITAAAMVVVAIAILVTAIGVWIVTRFSSPG